MRKFLNKYFMKINKWKKLEKVIKDDYKNMTGIVVMKDNNILYENYFNGHMQDDSIHIASVTKSITSILIGIAIKQGYIKSVHQKLLEFFPDYVLKRGENTIQKITIQNLLTMTAPYKYKSEPYTKVYSSEDWTKSALDLLGGKGIIGDFKYSTVGMQVLSGLLVNATGKSILDFAAENLFEPLNITLPKSKTIKNKTEYLAFLNDTYSSGWIVDSKGVHTGGWGIALKSKDMAKIGQLYLNKGVWNNVELLSSKWIEDSTKVSSSWGELSYGYLWWILEDAYAAIGDGGNIIYVSPEKELVVAITSTFKARAKDTTEFIRKFILPLLYISIGDKINLSNFFPTIFKLRLLKSTTKRINHIFILIRSK